MQRGLRIWIVFVFICLCSCSQLTYRPHSAKQKYFARPHVQFMMAIAQFRETYGAWPPSLSELALKSPEYQKVIDDFQYQSADFVVKDVDKMTVYFYNYKKQAYYGDNDKIDLNAFHGRINFYKSNGKFVWKMKMK